MRGRGGGGSSGSGASSRVPQDTANTVLNIRPARDKASKGYEGRYQRKGGIAAVQQRADG